MPALDFSSQPIPQSGESIETLIQRIAVILIGGLTVAGSLSDVEIGAVEIKNSTDDTRATVGANGLYTEVRAVADGADATLGAISNAASAIGGTGTISAKLRLLTTLVSSLSRGSNSFAVSKVATGATLIAGTATLAARPTRRNVAITNLDDSPETIYYGSSSGVNATTGARLKAGQSQVVDSVQALYFFGAAGTGTIECVENFD